MAAALTMSAAACGTVPDKGAENNIQASTDTAGKIPEITLEAQSIELDGVNNARQLGGYVCSDGRKIKDGVLLRSAALDNLTDEGAKTR